MSLKKPSIYLFPVNNLRKSKGLNPYLARFRESFQQAGYRICERAPCLGITSIFANLDARVFIIHWVDLIGQSRIGKIQTGLFSVALWLLRMLRKDVVWVVHNRRAHRGEDARVSGMYALSAKRATAIVTHSLEGVRFLREEYGVAAAYIPHPVYSSHLFPAADIHWDFIIWGDIAPRKSIAEFLEYAGTSHYFADKTILVCGECLYPSYAKRIQKACNERIVFMNRCLPDDELVEQIQHARIILFPYARDSLLSSGALIYSLNFNKRIIGPRAGSFIDPEMNGIVDTYVDYADIERIDIDRPVNTAAIQMYIQNNTWEQFPGKLMNAIAHSDVDTP